MTTFYFVLYRELGVSSALDLDGATIALIPGTDLERAITDYFRENGMSYEPVPVYDLDEIYAMLESGAADVALVENPRETIRTLYSSVELRSLPETLDADYSHGDSPTEEIVTTNCPDAINLSDSVDDLDIDGMGGRDRIFGGIGDDTLKGGSGWDNLYGSEGRDRLLGNADNDRLYMAAMTMTGCWVAAAKISCKPLPATTGWPGGRTTTR